MQVSEKLASEILTILSFHIVAIIILFSASYYIFLRARKTPLFYSYLAVVAMLLLWMVSKILKTVSPNITLRWLFIVTQYLGIQFLGYFLVIFAYLYTVKSFITRRKLILWAVLPALCFSIVVTNPLHMQFYSYFDFYKDRFGPLFLPTQCISYAYILLSVLLLAKGFTKQPGYKGKKWMARLSAVVILFPLIGNIYYILFKLIKPLPWIFPFSVFDFTPIAGSISLVLFMIPAFKYRFFDMSPISFRRLFEFIPQGIVYISVANTLHAMNKAFSTMFNELSSAKTVYDFIEGLSLENYNEKKHFYEFISVDQANTSLELHLQNQKIYRVQKDKVGASYFLLRFTDISAISNKKRLLEEKNKQLTEVNMKLEALTRSANDLAVARVKLQVSQDMHDILGHSLTVVIGTAEMAMRDSDKGQMLSKLGQIDELLSNSLQDLKDSILGKAGSRNQTSLTTAIQQLSNENIDIDFESQRQVYELSSDKTEAAFYLCREAVTNSIRHGQAKTIHIILRYKAQEIEVFAIDDGRGCSQIEKHMGLLGIERRIENVGGRVIFASNGEKGFTIHAFIPRS